MPQSIHRFKGNVTLSNERFGWLALIAGGLLLFLIFLPLRADWLNAMLGLLQSLLALGILLAALVGWWQGARRSKAAEAAMREAAKDDAFWSPEALREQLGELFTHYWRAVAARDVGRIADRLTPYWYGVLADGLAEWRAEDTRPVIYALELRQIAVVGLEDWLNNRRDQVSVRVEAFTAYHATHAKTGELVEGLPSERTEQQLWQLVRGDKGWLVNRVELVAGPLAYRDCRILREAV